MSTRQKRYISGLFSNNLQKLLSAIIGFVATPIIIGYLGKEQYGIWIIIGNLLGYVGLMDFGITGAITALVAKNNNDKDEGKINALINNAFFLQIGILFVILVVGGILSFWVPDFFAIDPKDETLVWKTFLFAIIGYAISFPPKSFKGLIKGRQYIALVAWIDFASVALITLLNITMLHIGIGLIAMPIGAIVVRLLSYIPIFYFARKAYPNLYLSYRYFDWKEAKSILNVSSLWFVGTTSAIIIYSTDNIVIGKFITVEIVTMYYVTYRLSEFLRQRIYSISQTALPGFGQLIGQNDFDRMQYLYLKSQRFILGITIPIVFAVIFFNYDFVRLWVGPELFAGQAITMFFALLLFIMVFYHSSSIVLSSGMQLRPIAWSRGIEAILNLILSILGAKKFGIMGVAGATIVSNLLTSFWYIPYQTIKFLKLKPITLFREVYVFSFLLLLINIALYAIFYYTDLYLQPLIYKLSLFAICNLIAFWNLGASKELRIQIIERLKVIFKNYKARVQ